jgi:hypothetical protein
MVSAEAVVTLEAALLNLSERVRFDGVESIGP